jgi:hypothetical protein
MRHDGRPHGSRQWQRQEGGRHRHQGDHRRLAHPAPVDDLLQFYGGGRRDRYHDGSHDGAPAGIDEAAGDTDGRGSYCQARATEFEHLADRLSSTPADSRGGERPEKADDAEDRGPWPQGPAQGRPEQPPPGYLGNGTSDREQADAQPQTHLPVDCGTYDEQQRPPPEALQAGGREGQPAVDQHEGGTDCQQADADHHHPPAQPHAAGVESSGDGHKDAEAHTGGKARPGVNGETGGRGDDKQRPRERDPHRPGHASGRHRYARRRPRLFGRRRGSNRGRRPGRHWSGRRRS